MRVIHLVPSLAPHDAIGTHVRLLARALAHVGIETEIVAGEALEGLAATPFASLRGRRLGRDVVLWYEASTTSPMAAWLVRQGHRPTLMTYHNVTPWTYFERSDPGTATALFRARREIARLREIADVAATPSRYNARDLARLGIPDARVIPPLVELPAPASPAPPRPTGSRWLFVGRLVPHKRQDLLIAALAAYRRIVDPDATLALVGKAPNERRLEELSELATHLGVGSAVDFVGDASEDELAAQWGGASVYVSASHHEGFGFPLLEAMAAGLPVVALARGAVAETVGQAGLLVEEATPRALAAAVAAVEHDPALRARVHAAAQERCRALAPETVATAWRAFLWEGVS
jgi:glycosyltransferase involved in cell wall biosynthesis